MKYRLNNNTDNFISATFATSGKDGINMLEVVRIELGIWKKENYILAEIYDNYRKVKTTMAFTRILSIDDIERLNNVIFINPFDSSIKLFNEKILRLSKFEI